MVTTRGIEPGQIVRSLAGRDKGNHQVVLKIVDESYVYLVDGKQRTLKKPKKKKIFHVQITKEWVNLKIDENDLNDSYIRKQLKAYEEPRRV